MLARRVSSLNDNAFNRISGNKVAKRADQHACRTRVAMRYLRLIRTVPFVVMARMVGPPPFRGNVSRREMGP